MIDLTKTLTIFLISAGDNPNYDDCLKSLNNQTVKFKLNIIKDVRPCALQDPHLGKNIYGVKMYNHDIVKKYPYNLESKSCEMEQIKRMENDGYKYIITPDMTVFDKKALGLKRDTKCILAFDRIVLGKHSPKWTNELIFERYFNLMERFKIYHYTWLESLPVKLRNSYLKSPTELNFYAMMGAYTSVSAGTEILITKDKDFRNMKKQEIETEN